MRALGVFLTMAACLAFVEQAPAADCCGTPNCCAQCGCRCACQRKVCQVVCGTEKITKHCWCVECEEFCAPMPGCGLLAAKWGACRDCCCGGCSDDCCHGTCCENCTVPPRCGPVRSRKKLVKKEYECEVPVYKCVVKYLCPSCCEASCEADDAQPEAEPSEPLPAAPLPAPDQQAIGPAPLPRLYAVPGTL